MFRCGSKIMPKLRPLLIKHGNHGNMGATSIAVRQFNLPSRNDPFTQMENLVRDMERRFWKEVDYSFPWTSRLPLMRDASVVETTRIGGPFDESTAEKFKLVFNFPNSKPENIKVTLKDNLLTIKGKSEEATDKTKWSQSFCFEYTVPEGTDVEKLESLISSDGVLTIKAPKKLEEFKSIPIERE